MSKSKKIEATMVLEKVTKGAVRYANSKHGDSEAITVIYLRKSGLSSEPHPTQIRVIIET